VAEPRDFARALVEGDKGAFNVLVDQHSAAVFRICYRILGRIEEAEDATQETFVQAYRAISTFRGDGPPGAWIARIATRECWRLASSGAKRRAVHRRLDDAVAATIPSDWADPVRTTLAAEEQEAVRRAVSALGEPYREVVALRFFGELSIADIASATGRPEGTVKAQLHRGLARLRGRLREVSA
jgi:RNA polymerase sigma-70 factor (ECF subfamily)